MKKMGLLAALLVFSLLLVAGCGSDVVATVNGEKITRQELDKEVQVYKTSLEKQGLDFSGDKGKEVLEQLRSDVLKQMIDEKLLLQEAEKKGFEPATTEVETEMEKIRQNFKTEGEFKKFLTANGVNEPQLKDYIKKQLAVEKLMQEVTAGTKVTDEDAQEYYREHTDEFTQPEKRKVRHILVAFEGTTDKPGRKEVDAKLEATRLLEKIKAGADFEQLAKEHSDDSSEPLTITRGGGFMPEFEDAVFGLNVGEITSEPVKTMYGYHLIKLEEIIPSTREPFADVKEQIKAQLEEQLRVEKFTKYLEGLRQEAEIENKLANKDGNSTKK